jgi:hypothetical protein
MLVPPIARPAAALTRLRSVSAKLGATVVRLISTGSLE